MTTANFDTAISRVLGAEGRYVNNPNDPGGETNWGISKREYPNLDIAALTRAQAVEIYYRDLWVPIKGDTFPLSIGFDLLDFAVNSGISTATRALQRAVGVADDGVFGPNSHAALAAQSQSDTVMLYLAERLVFLTGLMNWPNAGRGWARRIAANLRYGALDT